MSIELENSFDVPVPPEQAWDVLLDVRRVAPCMPGATVDEVDGDNITGRIKVKVGPIALTYTGKARFTERDDAAHAITMEASGKETRGAGTATATVRAHLEQSGGQTRVVVRTSLNVTGRPAQFGRGVMSDVAGRLVEKFSANLAEQLAVGGGESSQPVIPNGAVPDSRLALPIEELNLATRSSNSLRGEGIQTVGELVARTGDDLLGIKNLGEKSIGEIQERLGEIGLALKDAPSQGSADGPSAGPAGAVSAAISSPAVAATAGSTRMSSSAVTSNGSGPGGHADFDGSAASDVDAAMRRDEPEDDALNLFDVAAVPLLKRVLPAVAAAAVLIWLGTRARARARRGTEA